MTEPLVYQIKITLKYIRPPIWRRVLIPGDFTLAALHEIIQIVMGWKNRHLHQFTIDEKYYSGLNQYFNDLRDIKNANDFKIEQVVNDEKDKIIYDYDFGDGWEHIILVEKIVQKDSDIGYPICIKGKRSCPPEEVGGVWGYEHFIESTQDKRHPKHEFIKEWHGGDFDPEYFDINHVNEQLKLL